MPAARFLKKVGTLVKDVAAAVVATADSLVSTDATGRIDSSFLPVGVGPEVTLATATEALAAGDFVNIYNNGGVTSVRKADATTNGKPANGFVLANVANAGQATIYRISQTNTALTGLTRGARYYLSKATPGAVVDEATAGAYAVNGNIIQELGYADSATSLVFSNETFIEIAA